MASFPRTPIGPVWLTAHALTVGLVRHESALQVSACDIEAPAPIPDDPDGAPSRNGVTRVRGGWFLSYTDAMAEARRMAQERTIEVETQVAKMLSRETRGVAWATRYDALRVEQRALAKVTQDAVVVRDGETGEVIPCA